MDRFLQTWLAEAYHSIYGEDEALPSIQQQFTLVGEYAFNLPEATASFDNILHELGQLYAVEQPNYVMEELIEFLLVFSVSKDCENREEFVGFILQMDAESQVYLMQIIKEHLSKQSTEDDAVESGAEAVVEAQEDVVPTESSTHHVATHHHNAANITVNGVCMTCNDHMQHITRLQEEIQRQKDSHVKEITALKQALATESNKVIDGEVTVVEKDKIIYQLQQQVLVHENKMVDLEKKAAMLQEYQQKVVFLQDELDIVRPKADKHDLLEGTILKLREKLEELSEIKTQLKRESASHNETFGKLVELEHEVEVLRKLKPQIESYREEVAEYHIALQEYKDKLMQKEDELFHLRANRNQLEEHQMVRLNEHQHLVEELRSTTEQLRERERSNGIGEGMCELNPVLMQELIKLRSENAELLSQLDQTSVEHLEKLQKDIVDQKCINHSLQSKWMTTKEALASALMEIDKLTSNLQKSQEANRLLAARLDECTQMAKEDLYAQKVKYSQKLSFQKRQHRASVTLLHTGYKQIMHEYRQELKETQYRLDTEQNQHQMTSNELLETQSQLKQSQEDMSQLHQKRQLEAEDHVEQVKRLKTQHSSELSQLQQQSNLQMQQMEAQQRQLTQQHQQRLLELQSDMDNEVSKRRKVERLKKMYEAEVQRQKMQLQAVGCSQDHTSTSGDYEIASKELKAMQEQLDHAHQEIVTLKNQLNARNVSSSNQVTTNPATESDQALNTSASHHSPEKTVTISRSLNRPVRLLGPAISTASASSSGTNNAGNGQMYSFLEQAELNDKRVEQLAREKREILSRSLEENKEKMELSQKLLVMDKENTQLKAELRKMTLEKERLERKYLKVVGGESVALSGKENIRAGVRNL